MFKKVLICNKSLINAPFNKSYMRWEHIMNAGILFVFIIVILMDIHNHAYYGFSELYFMPYLFLMFPILLIACIITIISTIKKKINVQAGTLWIIIIVLFGFFSLTTMEDLRVQYREMRLDYLENQIEERFTTQETSRDETTAEFITELKTIFETPQKVFSYSESATVELENGLNIIVYDLHGSRISQPTIDQKFIPAMDRIIKSGGVVKLEFCDECFYRIYDDKLRLSEGMKKYGYVPVKMYFKGVLVNELLTSNLNTPDLTDYLLEFDDFIILTT